MKDFMLEIKESKDIIRKKIKDMSDNEKEEYYQTLFEERMRRINLNSVYGKYYK